MKKLIKPLSQLEHSLQNPVDGIATTEKHQMETWTSYFAAFLNRPTDDAPRSPEGYINRILRVSDVARSHNEITEAMNETH